MELKNPGVPMIMIFTRGIPTPTGFTLNLDSSMRGIHLDEELSRFYEKKFKDRFDEFNSKLKEIIKEFRFDEDNRQDLKEFEDLGNYIFDRHFEKYK